MPQMQRRDAMTTLRFFVDIDGIEEGVFTDCSGLGAEVEVKTYEEGGLNEYVHKLPGRVKYTNITLKRGMAYSAQAWGQWRKWCQGIFKAETPLQRKSLTIRLCDPEGKTVGSWQVEGAFPVKWTGPNFAADSAQIAIESLEIAHNGFTYQSG
jgi:phage tail-like protein